MWTVPRRQICRWWNERDNNAWTYVVKHVSFKECSNVPQPKGVLLDLLVGAVTAPTPLTPSTLPTISLSILYTLFTHIKLMVYHFFFNYLFLNSLKKLSSNGMSQVVALIYYYGRKFKWPEEREKTRGNLCNRAFFILFPPCYYYMFYFWSILLHVITCQIWRRKKSLKNLTKKGLG